MGLSGSPTWPVLPGDSGVTGVSRVAAGGPGCCLATPCSAGLLSHLQAASGGEGSVRHLIVPAVPGGFLTLTVSDWGGVEISSVLCDLGGHFPSLSLTFPA